MSFTRFLWTNDHTTCCCNRCHILGRDVVKTTTIDANKVGHAILHGRCVAFAAVLLHFTQIGRTPLFVSHTALYLRLAAPA